MKISIVSPSFNQAAFIDATIASVAMQTYANKEHIICDGGSTDGSAERIRAAAAAHSHIRAVLEPDRGQADAINKGFRLATGEILAWINTDDKYADPEVFAAVVKEFERNPDADLIYARGRRIGPDGAFIREAYINRRIDGPEALKTQMGVFQPSVFFRRRVFERVGGLSEAYNLQLDYEYWIRMLQAGVRFHFMNRIAAEAVVHDDAKSTRDRMLQLSECISMIEDRYGEVPDEWVNRFARFYATRRDEKVTIGSSMSPEEEASAATIRRVVGAALGKAPAPAPTRIIVTSFDSKYFQQGLNLIASLHRTSFASFDEIVVYSLGLSAGEKELLDGLSKVRVVDYPDPAPADFPEYYEPLGRAYKVSAIAGAGLNLAPGSLVLWMDAGLCCCTDIDEVFAKIVDDEFFITDHDDSAFWPFFNVHFMHRDAVEAINPSKVELLAPHLCSCLVGYKASGRFQPLINDALRMGKERRAVAWPKVLDPSEKPRSPPPPEENRQYRDSLLANPARLDALTIDDLYARFPYYGHRTQSVYSVLAARYGAPVSSATLFHKSNTHSSRAAAKNWAEGADKTDASASRSALDDVKPQTRLYHHRGVFTDLSGLIFERASEPALIVANGPSLRGFDFEQLRGKVWVGMNAAYRFWDEQKLYPHIYVCFDTTVQDSHRDEIKRLIERRGEYGIRWFFLRKTFLDFWPEAVDLGCVFFLEDLQKSVDWFDRGKITTGSFSLYVLSFLGFSEVYILGVDLNYVEQITEAEKSGRELVITSEVTKNPNYFFDGYQRPGDRYNPPNRHPDMHLRSWQEASEVLEPYPIAIYNCNHNSAVRAFPFVQRDRTVAMLESRQMSALRASERLRSYTQRRVYWRRRLLTQIGAADHQETSTGLSQEQANRIGAWVRVDRSAKLSLAADGMNYPRSAHKHVDETGVVAALLSARRGRQHVMLDVGAHHGSSAQYFHRLGWSIHCFEPDPINRDKLQSRFGAAQNIKIDPRAVSDKAANNVVFYASGESTGISGLHAFHSTHREAARVEVTTVAEITSERGLTRVDFLKIDVEGFDFAVLRGVPWGSLQPDVIECEFEDAKTRGLGHTWRDVAVFLRDKGYAVYLSEWHPIVRYGVRHDWRRVVALEGAEIAPDSWGNILAFRDDPGFAAVREAFLAAAKSHAGASPAPASSKAKTTAASAHPVAIPSATEPLAVSAPPLQHTPPRLLYARFATQLKEHAPPVFTLLRFCKQVGLSLWRRRALTIPAAIAFVAWIALGLIVPAWSAAIWSSGAFALLLAGLAYVALRVRQFMERMFAENTSLREQLHAARLDAVEAGRHTASLAQQVAKLADQETQNKKALTGVRARLAQTAGAIPQLESEIAAAQAHAAQAVAAAEARVAQSVAVAVAAAQTEATQAIAAAEAKAAQAVAAAEARTAHAVAAVEAKAAQSAEALAHTIAKLQDESAQAHAATSERLAESDAQLSQAAERLSLAEARVAFTDKTATFNNASWYQRFNRRLGQEQMEVLTQWAKATPLKPTAQAMGYAAHRACLIEARMQGRLATSIEDILLRTLLAMSVKRPSLNVLEIGTLFGIGAAIMYDAMAPHFKDVHVTLIDPLDGYYGTKRLDILTGQPVCEETLRHNLAEISLRDDKFTLIKHLSTEAEAIERARERKYDVIVIDGDHTYDGVKADFVIYAPMLRQGGIVIFDDYSSQDWPDVKAFVDAEVSPLEAFEFVGHEWRTCAYRKRRKFKAKR